MKNQKELVSIIIPFSSGEQYIDKAIKSVLDQTYKNYELLLIENGPKDNSENIIKAHKDKRIRYFYINEGNVSNARNYGISRAKGKYIYFMDGDDTIENILLEKCIEALKREKVELVLFGYNRVSDKVKEIVELPWKDEVLDNKKIAHELIPPIIFAEKGEKSIAGTVWRFFTYRDNVDDLRFDKNIKFAEDVIFCIQLYSRIDSIYVLGDALYNYTLNSASALNAPNLNAIHQSVRFHKVLKDVLVDRGLYDIAMQRRFYKNQGKMYTNAISFASREKNKKLAKKSIKNIIGIYKKDRYSYQKLDYPVLIKATFVLMKINATSLLYSLYRCKEKIRTRNYS